LSLFKGTIQITIKQKNNNRNIVHHSLQQRQLEVLSIWSDHGTFSWDFHSNQDENKFWGQEIQEEGIDQEWQAIHH